jgi:hypothetical protein
MNKPTLMKRCYCGTPDAVIMLSYGSCGRKLLNIWYSEKS